MSSVSQPLLLATTSSLEPHKMSLARGERVYFDFDNGNIEPAAPDSNDAPAPAPAPAPSLASAFIGDILERPTGGAPQPPVAPSFKGTVGGFPAHKKRTPRVSAFKKERAANGDVKAKAKAPIPTQQPGGVQGGPAQTQNAGGESEDEKRQIDEENRQKLANMSQEEIEEEQRELLESLPPSLIQKLLSRANIDDGSNEMDWDAPKPEQQPPESAPAKENPEPKDPSTKKVSFAEPAASNGPTTSSPPPQSIQPSPSASDLPPDLAAELPDHGSMHFPRPSHPPDLDPSSPTFLENLHEKYFPNLPYDPSTLSWMTPIDPTDTSSPYHPSHQAFNPKDLRFDFKGALLAPSAARDIPVDQGLHHHADAPEAAGYTIAELAVMARSSVAAQRCVAFQTLGRVLYRLGKGEFGIERVRRRGDGPVQVAVNPDKVEEEEVDEDDIETDMGDAGSAMAAGLWKEVEEGKVIETMTAEAGREKGHLSSRTFAQEGLWNWRRGGGRKRAAV